jgi:hypothetical protein
VGVFKSKNIFWNPVPLPVIPETPGSARRYPDNARDKSQKKQNVDQSIPFDPENTLRGALLPVTHGEKHDRFAFFI